MNISSRMSCVFTISGGICASSLSNIEDVHVAWMPIETLLADLNLLLDWLYRQIRAKSHLGAGALVLLFFLTQVSFYLWILRGVCSLSYLLKPCVRVPHTKNTLNVGCRGGEPWTTEVHAYFPLYAPRFSSSGAVLRSVCSGRFLLIVWPRLRQYSSHVFFFRGNPSLCFFTAGAICIVLLWHMPLRRLS